MNNGQKKKKQNTKNKHYAAKNKFVFKNKK